MVPITDYLTPILPPNSTLKQLAKTTLALKAKKMLINPSCGNIPFHI